jgi:hypothetical protein
LLQKTHYPHEGQFPVASYRDIEGLGSRAGAARGFFGHASSHSAHPRLIAVDTSAVYDVGGGRHHPSLVMQNPLDGNPSADLAVNVP